MEDQQQLVRRLEAELVHAREHITALETQLTRLSFPDDPIRRSESETTGNLAEVIFNHGGDGILLLDLNHGIRQANPAFETLFALSTEHYQGKPLTDFFHSDYHTRINAIIRKAADNRQICRVEARVERADRTTFDIEISLAPVDQPDQTISHLVCILRDISIRRRGETALQKYAGEVYDLYNNAPAGYHSLDTNGVFVQINDTELNWLGYSREEVTGKLKFTDVITPSSVATFIRNFPIFKAQGWIKDLEFELVRKDGSVLPIMLSATAIFDENGQFSHSRSMAFDITELRQAQRAIAEERNLLRTVIDAVPDYIYVKDTQHRMVLNNLAHSRSLGMTDTTEAIGKTDLEMFPADLAAKFHADEDRLFETNMPILNTEERSIGQYGGEIWALTTKIPLRNLKGELIGLVGITHDITSLKASEEAIRSTAKQLRESRKMLQLVLDTIPARVFWKNQESVYLGCNRLFAEDAGLKNTADIIGKRDTDLPWETDQAHAYRLDDLRVIESGTPKLEYEENQQTASGRQLVVQTSKLPLRDENDTVIGIVGSYIDVSARHAFEEALAEKYQEEQVMQSYLKALHEITLRLARTDTLDEFYRCTVEQGLKGFGFERAAMLLYHSENGTTVGTYGTDSLGNLVDEHHLHLDSASLPDILKRTLDHGERFGFDKNATLFANLKPFGNGQTAVAALWNGEILGWLTIDNGVRHHPITKSQRDILALYALAVGALLARKRAEFALRESEERYRLLAENIKDVILKITPQGIYSFVTASCYGLLGYTPDELLNRSSYENVHPDDHAASQQITLEALRSNSPYFTLVHRLRHRAGYYVWVELACTIVRDPVTGTVIEIQGIARDISKRKQAEDALQQTKDQLQAILDHSTAGIFMKDLNGYVLLANRAASRTPALFAAEPLTSPETIHPNDLLVLKTRIPVSSEETLRGNTYWVTRFPIFDHRDRIYAIGGMVTDITNRKLYEESLERALHQEKELGELKSRFVSMASHEFRTPLAAILSTTETLIAYRLRLDSAGIDLRLDRIRQQVAHMTGIINDVLQLAQIQAGRSPFKPEEGDLDELCREMIEEFESQPRHQARLHYRCNTPVIATFDRQLMRQIISNILSNALKYSASEKPVYITLSRNDVEFELKVQDEGIGIPPEDMKHLFENFHRAANVGTISGTGLGLSIAKQAVLMHGGTITPESQLNAGTTFTVTIPIYPPAGTPLQ